MDEIPELKLTLEEVQPFDMNAEREETVRRLSGSPEIDALTSHLDVYDLNSIVTFGAGAAEKISQASDTVLKSMKVSQLDDSNELMHTLAQIMSSFDMHELEKTDSFFGRIFGGARKQLDKILEKYQTLGAETDRIYLQLKRYEHDIKISNDQLELLFQANMDYFTELEKYIVAGEQGCTEIRDFIEQKKAEQAETGDPSITLELETLNRALDLLEQRTLDLRTAETVALQSIPMIRMVQHTNMNLVRKINSAFIVTLPVFKQALAQAILMKRQSMQADALKALDKRTAELLKQNASQAGELGKLTSKLAATPTAPASAQTLQSSFNTIMSGIDETRRLQENARVQRAQDAERLEAIRSRFTNRK